MATDSATHLFLNIHLSYIAAAEGQINFVVLMHRYCSLGQFLLGASNILLFAEYTIIKIGSSKHGKRLYVYCANTCKHFTLYLNQIQLLTVFDLKGVSCISSNCRSLGDIRPK